MERTINHGHSVGTHIWIEDDADAMALLGEFPEKLTFDEEEHAENQEIREAHRTSETGLHPALNPALLSYLVEWNDSESRDYIVGIAYKPGFPAMFAASIGKLSQNFLIVLPISSTV